MEQTSGWLRDKLLLVATLKLGEQRALCCVRFLASGC